MKMSLMSLTKDGSDLLIPRHRIPTLVIRARVPTPPRTRLVRQALTGNVPQRLIHPLARLIVECRVFGEVEQSRHRGTTLALAQHSGLCQPTRRPLADERRRIIVQDVEQRGDDCVGP